jgi:prepilin-type N-terminal cleavage/methylation domain-containing protein
MRFVHRSSSDEGGFTLVETLVALSLFSMLSIGFYSVMFAGVRGSETSRSVARVSEESRLGFNRMVRDTREGDSLSACDAPATFQNCFRVRIDFNGDGLYQNPNALGDYEDLKFAFDMSEKTVTLNGNVLMKGVEQITGKDVFSYASNYLEYDANADGVTTWQELDSSGIAGVGNGNGQLDSVELTRISSVSFSFRIVQRDRAEEFYGEAQLRNQRG